MSRRSVSVSQRLVSETLRIYNAKCVIAMPGLCRQLTWTDNYQGEESDIVIVCLTRSNLVGDIGFMSSPQRVNVMLSRARNALIMIGNPDTFVQSHKGRDVWVPLMDELRHGGHIYNGVPVKCEQHPSKLALLTTKEHFNTNCPDGGCSEPWYVSTLQKVDMER
jgi:hypothetical protein